MSDRLDTILKKQEEAEKATAAAQREMQKLIADVKKGKDTTGDYVLDFCIMHYGAPIKKAQEAIEKAADEVKKGKELLVVTTVIGRSDDRETFHDAMKYAPARIEYLRFAKPTGVAKLTNKGFVIPAQNYVWCRREGKIRDGFEDMGLGLYDFSGWRTEKGNITITPFEIHGHKISADISTLGLKSVEKVPSSFEMDFLPGGIASALYTGDAIFEKLKELTSYRGEKAAEQLYKNPTKEAVKDALALNMHAEKGTLSLPKGVTVDIPSLVKELADEYKLKY